jgi:hypothetical protein
MQKSIFSLRSFWTVVLLAVAGNALPAQNPTYSLVLTNDAQTSAATYEFDIYLLRTGATDFEYANNSQYFININSVIKNGGTLSFSILSGSCELNGAQQILTSKVSFDATNNRLRIAAHTGSGAGSGTIISNISPGTKLGRFRVTNTVDFATERAFLDWYDYPVGFYTKMFAYVGGLNVPITDSTGHTTTIENPVLPVELVSFTSQLEEEKVVLQWTTATEVHNSGFELERKTTASAVQILGKQSKPAPTEWKKVGFIEGSGTSASAHQYEYTDPLDTRGSLAYRLKQINQDGSYNYIGSLEVNVGLAPKDYGLSQNYPNPFNPSTTFRFALRASQRISLKVYNVAGQLVETIYDDSAEANVLYLVPFDGRGLATGIYFYVADSPEFHQVKKMLLLK